MKSNRLTGFLASALALTLITPAQAATQNIDDLAVFTTRSLYFDKKLDGSLEDTTFDNGAALFFHGASGQEDWYSVLGKVTAPGGPEYHGGFAVTLEEDGYRYRDQSGVSLPGTFEVAFPFYDQYALVCQENRWFYIGKAGQEVLTHLEYDHLGVFSEGLAHVGQMVDGEMRYGYIDTQGNVKIPINQQVGGQMSAEDREHFRVSQDRCPYYDANTGLYGFQNEYGQKIIKAEYNFVYAFQEDLAYVRSDYFSGYVGNQGTKRINLGKYQGNSFENGYALVEISGNFIVPYNTNVVAVIENPVYTPPTESPTPTLPPVTPDTQDQADTTPVAPTVPQNIPPERVTAAPSSAKVLVNGEEVAFGAVTIQDYTYFRLTDLACALRGTASRFTVNWNGDTSSINLNFGETHQVKGDEFASVKSAQQGERFTSQITLDGENIDVLGYVIDGVSYFQLSGLEDYLDFTLGWDGGTSTITLDTRVLG